MTIQPQKTALFTNVRTSNPRSFLDHKEMKSFTHMRVVQIKPIPMLFWVKNRGLLKTVSMGVEADIPLMHQLIDPLHKNSLGCSWNHCTTAAFMSPSNPNPRPA
jgi:hypothetical protein